MPLKILFSIFVLVFFALFNQVAYAQTPITLSGAADNIIFDGKWTFTDEWKQSTLSGMEGAKIRISHYGDFVFILIDGVADTTFDRLADRATVCFDTKNNKNKIADENDFCFISIFSKDQPVTLQGGHFNSVNGNFKKIPNHDDLIAIAGISDKNNRYSKIPHISYEFKIPIEILERNNQYGFYVSMFDANKNIVYSTTGQTHNQLKIPSPATWQILFSPDKTLPEMPLPLLILSILLISVVIITRKINLSRFPVI